MIRILLFFVFFPLFSYAQYFDADKEAGLISMEDGMFIYKDKNGNILEKGLVKKEWYRNGELTRAKKYGE